MPKTTDDAPAFYPEEALEAVGIAPGDFSSAGVYALALESHYKITDFLASWNGHYDVDPPDGLPFAAVADNIPLLYVGATSNLLNRLHDHVAGDKRRVGLLAVCPPTELVGAWRYSSGDVAAENERKQAYELRAERGAACWVDGELV